VIFLYYTYPNQIDLLSPYFENAYIAEMSSNIMGEKDLSLGFLLSFWPDLLHPYEYLRTTKSGVSKSVIREAFHHMMSSLNVDAIILKMQTEVIATMRESSIAAAGGNIVNGDKLGPLRHQLPDYLTQEWSK